MTLSFYIFLCLSCLNSEAAVNFLYANCPSAGTTTYTRNSTYQRNLNFILSSLQSNSTVESGFYNLEVGQDPSDIVYGLFLCRGDVTQDICQECVNTAAGEIVLLCPDQKTALIVYDECTIRYSDRSFFSQWKMEFVLYTSNTSNVSTPDGFMALLENTTKGIAGQAANDQSGRKFATEEADFNSFPKLYTLAQCTTDLSVSSCYNCLRTAISYLPICCLGKQGGSVMLQSCNIRYELYPFYRITAEPQEDKEISQEVQLLDLVEGRFRNEHTSEDSSGEKGAGSQKLIPSFQLHILHAATNHFSDENKLGKGGFGPVYKVTRLGILVLFNV
ncbi:PREDICTED: cysteine-rich receptor-like protein kinase 25 [Theobroma cacao]|uniref:Cysteine-rich receptor-like protein kinase 25 n=1 Tax=Theobroma cacao TaxID=3641 RepID=A0AB32WLD6_THECC|nr:PREDICTED: cysteine-rich receptor-like protein kinase 25 [Theobroma cacao]